MILSKLKENHSCKIDFGNQTPAENENHDSQANDENGHTEELKLQEIEISEPPRDTSNDSETQKAEDNQIDCSQPQSSEITDGKKFNLFELHDHLQHDCPRNRSCYQCEKIFDSR